MRKLELSRTEIDDRLKDLEDERAALLTLRRLYGSDNGDAPSPAKKQATPTPPVHHSPLIVPTGATPAILAAVQEKPGIHLGDLIDVVLKKVPPAGQQAPRKNIANIAGQLVVKGRLIKMPAGGFRLPREGE